ncbi:MAG: Membrane protein containing transrane [Candidatus Saccharibacteria bacterium]|nr:Membrane protein containing transrane [Candidatus Saccharibacteria bacterium]
MIARTHDLASFTALSAVFFLTVPNGLTLSTVIVALIANIIGGITPDIDQPTAPFWRNLPIGKYFGRAFGMLTGGHRFLTHSFIGVAIAAFLVWNFLRFLSPIIPTVDIFIVWISFLIGVLSHLFMDMFTKEGVPLLLPIPIKFGFPPLKRLRITTGKKLEMYIVIPLLIALNVYLYLLFYGDVVTFLHSIKL